MCKNHRAKANCYLKEYANWEHEKYLCLWIFVSVLASLEEQILGIAFAAPLSRIRTINEGVEIWRKRYAWKAQHASFKHSCSGNWIFQNSCTPYLRVVEKLFSFLVL